MVAESQHEKFSILTWMVKLWQHMFTACFCCPLVAQKMLQVYLNKQEKNKINRTDSPPPTLNIKHNQPKGGSEITIYTIQSQAWLLQLGEEDELLPHAGWAPFWLKGANHRWVPWSTRPIGPSFLLATFFAYTLTHTPFTAQIHSVTYGRRKTDRGWNTQQSKAMVVPQGKSRLWKSVMR